MNNLKYLEPYFKSSSAESDTEFLKDVFVTSDDFFEIVRPQNSTVEILVGNKGSGKSALLEYVLQKSKELEIPAVKITPAELCDLDFEENISLAKLIKQIRSSILQSMTIEAGKSLSGLVNKDEVRLFQDAVNAGETQSTIADTALKLLLPIGKAITNIDFEKMLPVYNITSASRKVDIEKFMAEKSVFYVLLDDIDQICTANRPDFYDVIWGEILAVLKIAQELPNVYPIVSVRKEIWRKLSIDNGNRDKYDQIRDMVYELSPSNTELYAILEQRLRICTDKNKLQGYNLNYNVYAPYFEGGDCKLPTSNKRRFWSDYLVSSSRENPRDIIQLVKALIKSAIKYNRTLIADADVEATALLYSQERVHDVTTQNKDICINLETVIRSFAKVDFELSAESLRTHLSNIFGYCSIVAYGKSLQSTTVDDAFLLWDVLYNVGFINPRMADNTQSKKYSFIPYDKTLVKLARWNDMQKYSWDVHPCYRSFLCDIQEQDKKRILFQEDKERFKGNLSREERTKRQRKHH